MTILQVKHRDVQNTEPQPNWQKVSYLVISEEALFVPTFIDIFYADTAQFLIVLILVGENILQGKNNVYVYKGKGNVYVKKVINVKV